MAKHRKRRRYAVKKRVQPGASPGTLVADPSAAAPNIRVMAWTHDAFQEARVTDPSELRRFLGKHRVTWIDVDGLGNAQVIEQIGKVLRLHPLALEDVLSQTQRPKVEDYPENLFVVVRMVFLREAHVHTEQLALFVGDDFVATFQGNAPGDSLEPVRERIRRAGRIRDSGPDYLAYALIDAAIDYYFPVTDELGDAAERMEDELLTAPIADAPQRIQQLKQDLMALRRVVMPLRDVCSMLSRDDNPRIKPETRLFFRDCHDHTVQLLDVLSAYRELAASLTELYLARVGNRMNEVMKFLTLVATVFIPLTFIVGIYGMNFDVDASPWNMPELKSPYGYPAVMLGMLALAVALVAYFRHKGWLGPTR